MDYLNINSLHSIDEESSYPLSLLSTLLDLLIPPDINDTPKINDFIDKLHGETESEIYKAQLVGSCREKLRLPAYINTGSSDADIFYILKQHVAELAVGKSMKSIIADGNQSENMQYPGYLHFPDGQGPLFKALEDLNTAKFKDDKGSLHYKGIQGPAMGLDMCSEGYDSRFDYLGYGRKWQLDLILCLHVNSWPGVATEWLHRNRLGQWPSHGLIDKIHKGGYQLVPRSPIFKTDSEQFNDYKFWRISFSLAELELATSLNPVHRQCIVLMKILKGTLPTSVLSSYHVKRVAYWMFEVTPVQHFTTNNLGRMYLSLINRLLHHVVSRNLPHYFMKGINLFAALSGDHSETIARKLKHIRKNPLCVFANNIQENGILFALREEIRNKNATSEISITGLYERILEMNTKTYINNTADLQQMMMFNLNEQSTTFCEYTNFHQLEYAVKVLTCCTFGSDEKMYYVICKLFDGLSRVMCGYGIGTPLLHAKGFVTPIILGTIIHDNCSRQFLDMYLLFLKEKYKEIFKDDWDYVYKCYGHCDWTAKRFVEYFKTMGS